ncbi:glyoxalase/bleomycin resistance/dioxygenase family protein [Streptomyces sp. NBC_01298]|uniref:glyoxalase/bleomycin resistance/dioxygenase family protein n=1 Tax=Streptomyces sp. NBC_01298 TaxID=2903817 RepID=UPI002E13AAD8|nr:glyoxalase/bleomycin resistance/dioxygenase family protein [Streptomyces sp. NBC_01298]
MIPDVPGRAGRASAVRVSLLVLYTPRLEECRRFYGDLGLAFTPERHGRGPEHYAAVLPDGMVIELYPARDDRLTGALRLGLAVPAFDGSATRPRLAPGRQRLVDPDGRTVEITAVGPTEAGSAQG